MLESTWRIGERSRVVQRMCVYARSPRIDFVTDVEWDERQALLKVAFPTDIRNRRATYEIQFGTIDRRRTATPVGKKPRSKSPPNVGRTSQIATTVWRCWRTASTVIASTKARCG